jgi:hypothetical protein
MDRESISKNNGLEKINENRMVLKELHKREAECINETLYRI